MMKRNQVMEWTGVGAIYGNKKVVAAVRSEIRRILGPVVKRLIFLHQAWLNSCIKQPRPCQLYAICIWLMF